MERERWVLSYADNVSESFVFLGEILFRIST